MTYSLFSWDLDMLYSFCRINLPIARLMHLEVTCGGHKENEKSGVRTLVDSRIAFFTAAFCLHDLAFPFSIFDEWLVSLPIAPRSSCWCLSSEVSEQVAVNIGLCRHLWCLLRMSFLWPWLPWRCTLHVVGGPYRCYSATYSAFRDHSPLPGFLRLRLPNFWTAEVIVPQLAVSVIHWTQNTWAAIWTRSLVEHTRGVPPSWASILPNNVLISSYTHWSPSRTLLYNAYVAIGIRSWMGTWIRRLPQGLNITGTGNMVRSQLQSLIYFFFALLYAGCSPIGVAMPRGIVVVSRHEANAREF